MTRHVGEVYEGIISGVISMGIFVALENTVEGFVSVGDLPSDRYELDEINYTLDGSRYSFRIGESAIVEIKSVSIATRSINMRLVDNKNHLRKKRKGANI
jgi:ribonuclease R